VAADDGVDAEDGTNEDDIARRSPHMVAAVWLQTGRRRRGCEPPSHSCGGGETSEWVGDGGGRLPPDGWGTAARAPSHCGGITEELAMEARVESGMDSEHFCDLCSEFHTSP
jgi:hypothetical protein